MPRWTPSHNPHLYQQYHDRQQHPSLHITRMWNYSSIVMILLLVMVTGTLTNAFVIRTATTTNTDAFTISQSSSFVHHHHQYLRWNRNWSTLTESTAIVRPIITSLDHSKIINIDDDNDDDDDDAVVVTWLDESNDDNNNKSSPPPTPAATKTTWGSKLSPQVKQRIVLAGQQRAISNKQKRISDMDRKRRQLMFVKERQREKKLSNKVDRPIPLKASASTDVERIPLHVYQPGMKCYGTCISLTNFGAYIDIGSECDGLLHVTQMHSSKDAPHKKSATTTSTFINHPKQIVQPGDEILVTVRSINPTRKKLHLTLLPWDIVQEQLAIELETKALKRATTALNDDDNDNDNDDSNAGALTMSYTDRIPLRDIQIDDELWGEIKRVTDFGAYVEVGAIVDGFLHYMDHPSFSYQAQQPMHPTLIMKSGDRVRVWVSDVDSIRNRIKLTAHRPDHLPGPRREM